MKNKIILGLTIVVVIIGVIAFWPKKEEVVIKDLPVVVPERVITDYSSDTGAKDINLDDKQYTEVYLIKDLRNKVPIDRNNFLIDYDYNVNKFIVKYKDTKKGSVEFGEWLTNTGYSSISKQYFQIQ